MAVHAHPVMPGLAPGIHEFTAPRLKEVVDGRAEPGHDARAGA
jgi:hypothetical protein